VEAAVAHKVRSYRGARCLRRYRFFLQRAAL